MTLRVASVDVLRTTTLCAALEGGVWPFWVDSPSSRNSDAAAGQRSQIAIGCKFILVNPPDTVQPRILSSMQAGARREKIDALVSGPNAIQLHGMVEVFGLHANRVTNSGKRNRFGLRETVVDYTKDAGFDARMAEIQSRVDEVFTAMGAQKSGKPTVSWRADHAASTCRMGLTEADSVVDKNLRVHGIENLYVCSNAVFPSLGAINPTLTLTALALRLGDHLVGAGTAVEGP